MNIRHALACVLDPAVQSALDEKEFPTIEFNGKDEMECNAYAQAMRQLASALLTASERRGMSWHELLVDEAERYECP
jgi:hypothetical protein